MFVRVSWFHACSKLSETICGAIFIVLMNRVPLHRWHSHAVCGAHAGDFGGSFHHRYWLLLLLVAAVEVFGVAVLTLLSTHATAPTTSPISTNYSKSITLIQSTHCKHSLIYPCFTWALGAELAHTYQGLVQNLNHLTSEMWPTKQPC